MKFFFMDLGRLPVRAHQLARLRVRLRSGVESGVWRDVNGAMVADPKRKRRRQLRRRWSSTCCCAKPIRVCLSSRVGSSASPLLHNYAQLRSMTQSRTSTVNILSVSRLRLLVCSANASLPSCVPTRSKSASLWSEFGLPPPGPGDQPRFPRRSGLTLGHMRLGGRKRCESSKHEPSG